MQLLTAKQVASILQCRASTVYAWAADGRMPSYKINGSVRFDTVEVEEWIKKHRRFAGSERTMARKVLEGRRWPPDVDAMVRRAIDSRGGS